MNTSYVNAILEICMIYCLFVTQPQLAVVVIPINYKNEWGAICKLRERLKIMYRESV